MAEQDLVQNISLEVFFNGSIENQTDNGTLVEHFEWVQGLPISILLIIDTVVTLTWSIFANILILTVIIIDPKLHQKQHIYGFSLALSDLIGSICLGFGCYQFLYNAWPIENPGLCKFWNSVDYTCCLTTSLSISLISYDRYKMITHSIQHRNEETTSKVLRRVISAWVFSILFFVPVVVFWDKFVGYSVIAIDECDAEYKDVLYMTTIQSAVEFFLPFSIITFSNVKIIMFIHQRSRRMKTIRTQLRSSPHEITVFTIDNAAVDLQRKAAKLSERDKLKEEMRNIRWERKASRSLTILIVLFFCCWFPWEVVGNFVQPICKCVPDFYYNISYWIQYHMFAVNSFVYGMTVDRLRFHFRRVFAKLCPLSTTVAPESDH